MCSAAGSRTCPAGPLTRAEAGGSCPAGRAQQGAGLQWPGTSCSEGLIKHEHMYQDDLQQITFRSPIPGMACPSFMPLV